MHLSYRGQKSIQDILKSSNKNTYSNQKFNANLKHNYVFFGDNFDVMSYLNQHGMHHKIDLVYIDPPFATRNIFTMTNHRVSTISHSKHGRIAYSDKLYGDDYLEFMKERLVLLKELLSRRGTIYVHINDEMGSYLKILMDEIFGVKNYLNVISRVKSNPKNFNRRAYGNQKDIILVYAKNHKYNIFNNVRVPFSKSEIKKKFKQIDKNGHYTTTPLHAPGESRGITGEKWHGMYPPDGRHWRTTPKHLTKLNNAGLIHWSRTGNPRFKRYAKNSKGRKMQDVWLNYKDAPYPEYPTQKNQDMLNMIVRQSSKQNSIVLDAFAGSGSTLLAANKYHRKFIGIDKSPLAIKLMKVHAKCHQLNNVSFI